MDTHTAQTLIESEAARVDREKSEKPGLPGISESDVGGVSGQRLKSYLERIERLAGEISGLQDDQKDIYAECKAFGFNVPTVRQIVRLRRMDAEKRREADMLLETYRAAVGLD